jgi:lipopolysaccharide transport system ATP-binding protein
MQEGMPKDVCDQYLEAFYEVHQGKSSSAQFEKNYLNEATSFKDQRLDFLNSSNLRNDLQIFKFDPESPSFGKGGAQIYDVRLLNEQGESLAWIIGGEKVVLRIMAKTHQELNSPIIGFYIKDRLGQTLFGDNTFLTYQATPIGCNEEDIIQADFIFYMPLLPRGEYSINVAIANGTQELHEQHHWIHDALFFKSESSSVSSGLIGIPMQEIKLVAFELDHLELHN